MVRRSPQTERLVEIVECLAENPTGQYRLADFARLVEMDKATCYPMLAELTRVGWLVKDPVKKTYRLGPRVVRIGAAAAGSLGITEIAQPAMAGLSESVGCASCLIVPSARDLLIADLIALDDRPPVLNLQPGDRIDFRPPLGSVLVAWGDFYSVDHWLHRDPVFERNPERYWRMLQLVRERHFAVELFPSSAEDLRAVSRTVVSEVYGPRRAASLSAGQNVGLAADMLLTDIDDETQYEPLSINAAIFDSQGTAVAAICIIDLNDPVSAAQLLELGARVAAAADSLTAQLGGQQPWTLPQRFSQHRLGR